MKKTPYECRKKSSLQAKAKKRGIDILDAKGKPVLKKTLIARLRKK